MRRIFCFGLIVASWLTPALASDTDASPLAGTWRIDPSLSSDLSGWDTLKLIIAVDGPRITLTRQFASGRRTFTDVASVDLSRTVNVVAVDFWPDNRYIGAYMGGDKTKKLKFRVLNDGHLLRTSADFVLATQQGEHEVNVLRNYKVSSNGMQLTLTVLRSTRDEPIIYVFQRVLDDSATAPKGKAN